MSWYGNDMKARFFVGGIHQSPVDLPPPPRASNAFDAFFVVSLNKLFKNNQVSSHDAHVTSL